MERDWILLAAVFGVTGVLTFSYLWSLAVVADGNWILGEETLSELGGDRAGRAAFNLGAMATGVLAFLFSTGFMAAQPSKWSYRAGPAIVLVGSVALFAVGLFPITTGSYHTVASYSFFGVMLLGLLALVGPLWKNPYFGKVGSLTTIVGVIIPLSFLVTTPLPLAEAVAVICLMAWMAVMSIQMALMHRKEVRTLDLTSSHNGS
ncbi:MAG: DUF998 domain-containing protein [Methanomassiliicoccales archaeon]